MIFGSLIHPSVQLVDLFAQEFFLNWHELAESAVVASEQLVELVNVSHVVLLLKGNVGDSLWDCLTDSVQEFGFSDDNLKLWSKVNIICVYLVNCFLLQNKFF